MAFFAGIALSSLAFAPLFADEVSGVNLFLEEGMSARYSALSETYLGIRGDVSTLTQHPAALNDVDPLMVSASHLRKFGLFNYDYFAFSLPYNEQATLGFAFSRFAGETEVRSGADPDFQRGTLETADYSLTGAFARRWRGLDLGANLHVVYRRLDQQGLGTRADLSAQYRFWDRLTVAGLFKGILPSSIRWESETLEYSPSDFYLGAGYEWPSEYFYGRIRVAYQSEGWFQKQAKSESSFKGRRIYQNPEDVFLTGNLGLEYALDMGLHFRFGFPEWGKGPLASHPSMGLGYVYKGWLGLDYSFTTHPELQNSHRVSLFMSPSFGGKRFHRPGKTSVPETKTREKESSEAKSEDALDEPETQEEEADESWREDVEEVLE